MWLSHAFDLLLLPRLPQCDSSDDAAIHSVNRWRELAASLRSSQ